MTKISPAVLRISLGIAALLALAAPGVQAQTVQSFQPSGVVSLSSSASVEVPKDMMTATLSTSREGQDADALQADLKKALDAALAEARRAARPGQVDVHTGNFSLVPRYSNKGVMAGWQGTAELVVEGRDMPAIGQLVGRISTLTVARVGYGLSREAREKTEADVAGQAIARYQAKAAEYAKRFGYGGYTIREVNVSTAEAAPVMYKAAMAAAPMSRSVSDELPIEAGKQTVSVSVNGTVQLSR